MGKSKENIMRKRLSPILLWILGLVTLGSARVVGSTGSRSSLKMGNSARTSQLKSQNAAFIQEKQVRDMIMRQIELLTNKRHLLPKSRLKRAHFGRIHKRNARRKGGIGSLKSDNRAEKNRSDRKEKDRNKGERNHKRRNLNEKRNRLQLHRISSSRLRQNRDQAKRHLREQNAVAIGRNGRNSGRGCFSNGLSMLDDLGNFNCNQVPSFVRTGK